MGLTGLKGWMDLHEKMGFARINGFCMSERVDEFQRVGEPGRVNGLEMSE